MFRLYPPYLVALVLSLIVLALIPAAFPEEPLSWSGKTVMNVVTHLTMCHNLFQNFAWTLANSPFWSLGMEEQLYALYAVYLFLLCRGRRRSAVVLALAVTVVWRLCQLTVLQRFDGNGTLQLGAWSAWPFGHWFAWILGAAGRRGVHRHDHAARLVSPRAPVLHCPVARDSPQPKNAGS